MKKTFIKLVAFSAIIVGFSFSGVSAHHSFSHGFHSGGYYKVSKHPSHFNKKNFSFHTPVHRISLAERKKREEIARKTRVKKGNFNIHRNNRFHRNSRFHNSRNSRHFGNRFHSSFRRY